MCIYSPYLSNVDLAPKHHHDDGSPIEREGGSSTNTLRWLTNFVQHQKVMFKGRLLQTWEI